jgi:hypothetical protein
MKKFLIVFIVLGLFSCKKKKEDAANDPTPVAPARVNAMTASVNGSAWEVLGNETSNANIDQSVYNGNPKQYVIGGRTDKSLNKNAIHVGFTYTTGTVSLENFTGFYALYYDSTGLSYPVKSGTLNIVAIDTSHKKSSACDKFKATFSFVTDKFLGQTYTVTNGSIDFEVN